MTTRCGGVTRPLIGREGAFSRVRVESTLCSQILSHFISQSLYQCETSLDLSDNSFANYFVDHGCPGNTAFMFQVQQTIKPTG